MNWLKNILKLFGFREHEKIHPQDIEITTTVKPLIQEAEKNIIAEDVIQQVETGQVIVENELRYITPATFPVILNSNKQTNCTYLIGINRNDKGVMEDYFFDYADVELKKKLKNDVQIELPNFIITPDFIYADEVNSIFVVIEIDEPYSINDRGEFIPTHYKGLDNNRNKALLTNGWSIIRFAEEQIVKNTIGCFKFLTDFINNQNLNQVDTIDCWTVEQAQKMITDEYRNSYLPIKFQGNLRTASKYSFRSLTIISISCFNSKKDERFTVLALGKNIEQISGGYRYDDCGTCWISEKIFADKIKGSEYGEYLKSLCADYTFFYYHVYFPLPKVKIEALGYQEKQYFNLRQPNEFNIIYPQNFYPTHLSNEEFTQKHKNIMQRLLSEYNKMPYLVHGKQDDGTWMM